MKKKFLVLAVAALMVGAILIPAAFAARPDYGDWYDQMFDWHIKWVDDAVKSGQISKEQAEAWKDHFNYMREFHKRYPMGMMMGGYGMMGPGYGYGMMGGYGYSPGDA